MFLILNPFIINHYSLLLALFLIILKNDRLDDDDDVCPSGRGDLQPQLDSAMQDVSDRYLLLEETEKQAVRKALVEERSRFCCFVSMLRPVVVS